jgi:hypothetical protein
MPIVVCRYCGQAGDVTVLRPGAGKGTLDVVDEIEHEETCKLYLSRLPKRQPRHLTKKRWKKQETRAASLLNASETPASGALGEDGDARSIHGVRVECKQSETGVYHLSQQVWEKLVRGARRAGEIPVLEVELTGKGGSWRIYAVPLGTLAISSKPLEFPRATARLPFQRGIEVHTPFHSELLDPPVQVVVEQELMEALTDAVE